MDAFDFDTILFPINWALYLNGGLRPGSAAKGTGKEYRAPVSQGTGQIRAAARESTPYPNCWYIPIDDGHLADLALRFTLSQPVNRRSPPGDIRLFRLALDIAENFTPHYRRRSFRACRKREGR